MVSERWEWLVSGGSGKSCSSDVESMNLEWKIDACLCSLQTVTSQHQLLEFAFILQLKQFAISEVESKSQSFSSLQYARSHWLICIVMLYMG